MSPSEQAAALQLLKRWRDLCLAAENDAQLEKDLPALTLLFVETDAFLDAGLPPQSPKVGAA